MQTSIVRIHGRLNSVIGICRGAKLFSVANYQMLTDSVFCKLFAQNLFPAFFII